MNPPDLPPPLPNQPPVVAPPRKGMSTGVLVLIIVVAVAVLFAGLAALAIPAFQRIQKLAQETKDNKAKAAQPPKPLTAEQKQALQVFGDQLAAALTEEDDAKVKSLLNAEGLADRVFDARTAGFPQAREMRGGFVAGAMKHPGGWLRNLMGVKVKALRTRERDGYPAVLLRMMPEDGGVNYVDIVATPDSSGTFRAVDMFTYMYASYFSDETRNLLAVMMPDSGAGKLAAWFGVANFDNDLLDQVKSAAEAMRTGKFTETLRICDSLPEKYRSHRMFFMMRLQALMALNGTEGNKHDAAYKEVLRAAPDILGKDSTTDLLMIDLYFLDNQLAEADACIERVQKVIGGDPYLKVLRANTRRMMKDYEGALKLANEAQQEEPDLNEAIDSRLSIRAEQKDFPGLVEELRAFKRSSGIVLDRESLSKDPQFTELLASPEFAAWEKEIAKP
jgi:tetratricopeptide (TPR) repeat protein